MAVEYIYPGSSSFSEGQTPFGTFDTDAIFQADAPKIANWCAKRLGYPIQNVELVDDSFYSCFEEATAEYAAQVNQFNISSVELVSNSVVPIPGTGINVATIYLRSGTEQFDLDTYFDYNKEYLSFPLTNIADSLYFAVDSEELSTGDEEFVSLGVTWEEQ